MKAFKVKFRSLKLDGGGTQVSSSPPYSAVLVSVSWICAVLRACETPPSAKGTQLLLLHLSCDLQLFQNEQLK